MTASLCSHCFLPLGHSRHNAQVAGDERQFCCYGCCLAFQVAHGEHEEADAAWLLIRLGVGAFLAMNIMLFSLLLYSGTFDSAETDVRPIVHWVLFFMATPTVIIIGGPFVREAWQDARRLRLGSSALITLGAGAAYFYSVMALTKGGDRVYFDTATMVLVLFTLGRYLEAAGRARAMRSIAPMLAPEREWVTAIEDGVKTRIAARDVHAGMTVLVRPGERIGVDGVVVEGASHVGEAILTGESTPVAKHPGASVLAGSVNHEGPLLIEARNSGAASYWMHIARRVREALGRRSRIERLAERAAGIFVPIVLGLALVTTLYWADSIPFGQAMLNGLAVLVVACPCALGLAAPLATSIGIGQLARRGCLVRDGDMIESLALVQTIAFDKTGTLTFGEPRLSGIAACDLSPDNVLALAAALETRSEHPLANGIMFEAERRGLRPAPAQNIRAVPGCGILGTIDDVRIAAGSPGWIEKLGFSMPDDLARRSALLEDSAASLIGIGWGAKVVGILAFEDPLRPEAPDVVAAIRKLNIKTLLLSGDRASSAQRVARAVGIDQVESGMTPDAKQAFVAQGGDRWAMVGDGLNDAPVLASAGVGIAVGSATDLAREAAGLVLPEGGLATLPYAVNLSRAVRRIVIVNLLWAFGYNTAALALAATGHLLPVFAAALMAGSSVIVVLNSLRLEQFSCRRASPIYAVTNF